MPEPLIMEHTYKDGLRSRWYRCENFAKSILESIPAEMRGVWTVSQPLRTSSEIWRVDDFPQASGKSQK